MRPQDSEVLVAGAGPVGMVSALLIARQGINVQIIDEAPGAARQSYACGLHSRTIGLLRDAGLHEELLKMGRRIDRIAFYEGALRRCEIPFAHITPDIPYMLVLPQAQLESLLESTLAEEANVRVNWDHRLSDLHPENSSVTATIDKLSGTATGFDVPRWETMVQRSFDVRSDYVIGCDGYNSAVRRAAGIEYQLLGQPELFVVYEFDTDAVLADEIRVVLNEDDTNVLWPLPNGRCRWSFQWTATDPDGEFPHKDRNALWSEITPVATKTKQHLQSLLQKRAPWFVGSIENMDWATDVQFEHRLARNYGQGRCWLVGDAAHQTGPVGVQSMNVGIREADVLARQLKKVLRGSGSMEALQKYEQQFISEWQRLLGVTTELAATGKSPLRYRSALLSCLPGSGPELDAMLQMLGLELKNFCAPTGQRK
jgi:2-polyprenyl-6-methoxyphenol hydroxylase-like FAD-dependent oxidoreductase